MFKHVERRLIVGLEIGTTKVVVLVGELLPGGAMRVIGVGRSLSYGMDKGGVNNLELVAQSVRQAVDEAERMTECQISSVYLALSGRHIRCQNELGLVPLAEAEVTQEDIDSAMHTAQAVRVHDEHTILHVIPQEFAIDYQDGIKNPLGLSGVRMQARVHLITCHQDMSRNLLKAVTQCGVHVKQAIFSGFATSHAVLTEDERELGVALIDIGGGTMDIAVYVGGSLWHTQVIPYAGNIVTRDIAYAFGTPLSEAERIKIQYGCVLQSLVCCEESIEVPSVGGRLPRLLLRKSLAEVVEARYYELLSLVLGGLQLLQQQLQQQGIKYQLAAGVVLTGGAARIEGLVPCAERLFQTPVRIGSPHVHCRTEESLCSPDYATAVGLLHYGQQQMLIDAQGYQKKRVHSRLWERLSGWFKQEF